MYIGIGREAQALASRLRTATLAELEAYVHAFAASWRRDSAEWDGHARAALSGPSAASRSSSPPTGRSRCGSRGDRRRRRGGLGVTPEVVRGCLELVAEGAREAGRAPEDVEVWFTCFWLPTGARDEATWAATAFALHFARSGVEGKFVPEEHREAVVELGRAYDLISHGAVRTRRKTVRRACRAARDRRLPAPPLRLLGTPDEVEGQIRGAMEAGARRFDGAIDADLPEHRERIETWARLVLPRFA